MKSYSQIVDSVSIQEYKTLRSIADSLIMAIMNGEANIRELAIESAGIIDTVFGPEFDAEPVESNLADVPF